MPPAVIHRVTQLDLKYVPWRWPFAEERRGEIDTYFAGLQAAKPRLWNGRVLLGRNPRFSDDCFSAEYFETDFASFIAWRDWGFPDQSVFNGFGMGALRSNDGAFVVGEMAAHTANAGRIYFPAGTPDLDDIRNGMVDIAGSVARETEEETGLTVADYRTREHWDCVVVGAAIAVIGILDVNMPGDRLRAKIEADFVRQVSPELSAIHLVRNRYEITGSMPRYVVAFLEAQFNLQEPHSLSLIHKRFPS